MLSISREPLYKNKLFLSSVSVVTGFVMTVGVIRAVNPADTAIRQSAQTSDRRAGLIPITASSSESSSESDTGSGKSDEKAGVASNDWRTAGNAADQPSKQHSSNTTTNGSSGTPPQLTSSGLTTEQTTTEPAQPSSAIASSTAPTEPKPDCLKLLNQPIICI